jgi:hypothetical protein
MPSLHVGVMQLLLRQIWPEEHVWPQAPQLLGSESKLASQPLLALPSQLPKPTSQVITQVLF